MPARDIKFLFVLAQLGAAVVCEMNFANCVAIAAVLIIILIENLRLCSSAEAENILNLFLNFEQK